MASGKTTAAEYFIKKHGFMRVAFADALKEKAKRITDDGQIDKVRDRGLLQYLGTEYFRGLDPEYWIKKHASKVEAVFEKGISVVTDDCRFENEVEAIHKLGGKVVYLTCSDSDQLYRLRERDGFAQVGISGHASEKVTGLKPLCDYFVENHGSLDRFYDDLETVYTHLKGECSGCAPCLIYKTLKQESLEPESSSKAS